MITTRPRVLLVRGSVPLETDQARVLRAAFDLVQVDDAATAQAMARQHPGTLVIGSPADLIGPEPSLAPADAATILRHVAEGIGVVDARGAILWMNSRLRAYPEPARQQFSDLCRAAIERFNADEHGDAPFDERASSRCEFTIGERHFELIVSPNSDNPADETQVNTVVGVLIDISTVRVLEAKLEAINQAGDDLMRLDAAAIRTMNMAERLKALGQKIVRYARDLLHFDNFEVRLLDRKTGQLELVFASGIAPLKIGEVMYARPEGHGISGYVATTGRSYLCPDVRDDTMYREGLENAASSLTVPLRLHDRVVGVLNIESAKPSAFDDNDRRFAELFGRHVALAMNTLDLLVVERYTTNEQVTANVLCELGQPLEDLLRQARALEAAPSADERVRQAAAGILRAAENIRSRIDTCTSGPRTVLGVEQELSRQEPDPLLIGKRVLIGDDGETIRLSMTHLLRQKGCEVTACANGLETIEAIEAAVRSGRPFDIVISDIKMPDRNGYEVFRAAKAASPTTQVILMTGFGYDPHHSIVRASLEGLHSFLFKPFRAAQLIEEIGKALAPPAAPAPAPSAH
jgi:CheY-like chemotaxis protein/GAF domain-containing protein